MVMGVNENVRPEKAGRRKRLFLYPVPLPIMLLLGLMMPSCGSVGLSPDSALIHRGAGSFTFSNGRGNPNKPISVWYYRPAGFTHDTPMVFVMHGVNRNARQYRDEWVQYAERYGFLLIVPEFSRKYYPGKREYNDGNLFDKMDNPIPENDRVFTVIENLFDFVKDTTQNRSPSYDIYGHCAGGQLVQRMVLFRQDARIRTAIAANPCLYVFVTYSEKYPLGIRNSGITPDHLRKAFEKRFILLLGEQDIGDEDANFAGSVDARHQGRGCFDRGINFFGSATDEAFRLGMIYNWHLKTLPGTAHQDPELAETAAQILFSGSDDERRMTDR